jgi:hypothetical protein
MQGTTPEGVAPIGLPSPPGRPALLANESFLRSPSFLGKADPRSLVGSASLMKVRRLHASARACHHENSMMKTRVDCSTGSSCSTSSSVRAFNVSVFSELDDLLGQPPAYATGFPCLPLVMCLTER